MRCLLCKDGTMESALTTYFVQLKNCYVIIENVPCMKCEQCGEEVFSASVLERIDEIVNSLQKVESKIFITEYSQAA